MRSVTACPAAAGARLSDCISWLSRTDRSETAQRITIFVYTWGDSDVVLRPHNGDRIVTIDSMTSLHPRYTIAPCIINHAGRRGHWRGWGVQLRLSVCPGSKRKTTELSMPKSAEIWLEFDYLTCLQIFRALLLTCCIPMPLSQETLGVMFWGLIIYVRGGNYLRHLGLP